MKLALISDDGQVIDTTDDFTREEWDVANVLPLGAISMLNDLNADAS